MDSVASPFLKNLSNDSPNKKSSPIKDLNNYSNLTSQKRLLTGQSATSLY